MTVARTRKAQVKPSPQLNLFGDPMDADKEYWGDWRDNEVQELQYDMLVLALEEIRDHRKSTKMRQEAWDWLMNDNEGYAFSSHICALANGLDIDAIRSQVRRFIKI